MIHLAGMSLMALGFLIPGIGVLGAFLITEGWVLECWLRQL